MVAEEVDVTDHFDGNTERSQMGSISHGLPRIFTEDKKLSLGISAIR